MFRLLLFKDLHSLPQLIYLLCKRYKVMNDFFTIIIDNEPLEIRKLNFKNYPVAYEIWKKIKFNLFLFMK
jgi:hypothetical protein